MSTLFRPCCGEVEMAPLRELQCLLTELNSCRGEWSWPRMAVASENWELSILKEKDTSEVNGNDENYAMVWVNFWVFRSIFVPVVFLWFRWIASTTPFDTASRTGCLSFTTGAGWTDVPFGSLAWRHGVALLRRAWDMWDIYWIFSSKHKGWHRKPIGKPRENGGLPSGKCIQKTKEKSTIFDG